ncbi:MAG: site-2 protease family protein [Desulfurococcales archaeon]|jgi:Zn-dependent protease|nr:site-2 protease family protein [Desulfurococcales archaeon]
MGITFTEELKRVIGRRFAIVEHVKETLSSGKESITIDIFRVIPLSPGNVEGGFRELYRELIPRGYYPQLRLVDGSYYLRLYNIGNERGFRAMTVLLLMVVTIVTVGITSYIWYRSDLALSERGNIVTEAYRLGPLYIAVLTLSILGPLAIHEMGHYIASRILRVPATPPYFIPGVPGIGLGTFGAVILMRFTPAVSDDLAIVAISGPLAGFIAIIAVTLYGISTSYIVPREILTVGFEEIRFTPLLFAMMVDQIALQGSNNLVILNPVAYAGYFLMLIHFLNLLPVAQLDGGQVLRSLVGLRMHTAIGVLTTFSVVVASLILRIDILYTIAFFLVFILLLTGLRPHPGPAYSEARPGRGAVLASILWILMLALTIPIPA